MIDENANTIGPDCDVAIAGGGMAGLALALALRRGADDLSVMVIDAGEPGARGDTRASAIILSARRMLTELGVWQRIADTTQAIEETVITDSRGADVARPSLLSFVGPADDGEPVAHMVENDRLAAALRAECEAAGVVIKSGATVRSFTAGPTSVQIDLGDRAVTSRLLVAADGSRSRLRRLAGIATVDRPYNQVAIVATVEHERPHHGRATEHFLPAGPFAILPLTGNRASLVWTEKPNIAAELLADDEAFVAALTQRFGHQLGWVKVIDTPTTYPLGLSLARSLVKPRFALVGDAAHTIHPIAGQGFNLGLRDVAALAETVVEAHRLGLDIGSLQVLERYQRWRRFDMTGMGIAMDVINMLFSNDNPVLRIFRDTGLGIVDRLPMLKRRILGEAAGVTGEVPRLLRGEPI